MANITSTCKVSAGDTALMMAATSFVMLQTPAIGITQAGLIRRKNSLSMLMQTLTGMVIGSLLWFMFGFSLTFAPTVGGAGLIGSFQHAFFLDLPVTDCSDALPATTIPATLYACTSSGECVCVAWCVERAGRVG